MREDNLRRAFGDLYSEVVSIQPTDASLKPHDARIDEQDDGIHSQMIPSGDKLPWNRISDPQLVSNVLAVGMNRVWFSENQSNVTLLAVAIRHRSGGSRSSSDIHPLVRVTSAF